MGIGEANFAVYPCGWVLEEKIKYKRKVRLQNWVFHKKRNTYARIEKYFKNIIGMNNRKKSICPKGI